MFKNGRFQNDSRARAGLLAGMHLPLVLFAFVLFLGCLIPMPALAEDGETDDSAPLSLYDVEAYESLGGVILANDPALHPDGWRSRLVDTGSNNGNAAWDRLSITINRFGATLLGFVPHPLATVGNWLWGAMNNNQSAHQYNMLMLYGSAGYSLEDDLEVYFSWAAVVDDDVKKEMQDILYSKYGTDCWQVMLAVEGKDADFTKSKQYALGYRMDESGVIHAGNGMTPLKDDGHFASSLVASAEKWGVKKLIGLAGQLAPEKVSVVTDVALKGESVTSLGLTLRKDLVSYDEAEKAYQTYEVRNNTIKQEERNLAENGYTRLDEDGWIKARGDGTYYYYNTTTGCGYYPMYKGITMRSGRDNQYKHDMVPNIYDPSSTYWPYQTENSSGEVYPSGKRSPTVTTHPDGVEYKTEPSGYDHHDDRWWEGYYSSS